MTLTHENLKYLGNKPRQWIYNRPLFTSQKISQIDTTATVRFFALQNLVRGSGGGMMHRRTVRQTDRQRLTVCQLQNTLELRLGHT